MGKNVPIRYVSEEAVKRALRIDSFRNLSKDKVMQFASMIPYMDKDVAIAVINQFPEFADFGKTVVSRYMEMCDSILERNKESEAAVIHGYQTILDALYRRMDSETITEEERKSITEDMILVADKVAEVDMRNKKFLERMGTKILWGVLGVVAVIGAGIGVNSAISNSGELPGIEDNEKNE